MQLSPVLWEILSVTIWITGNLPIFTCPIACDLQKSLLLHVWCNRLGEWVHQYLLGIQFFLFHQVVLVYCETGDSFSCYCSWLSIQISSSDILLYRTFISAYRSLIVHPCSAALCSSFDILFQPLFLFERWFSLLDQQLFVVVYW